MKKSFLALAVAALAATSIASTASATTVYDKDGTSLAIYGRVQSVFYAGQGSNVINGTDREETIKTSGRLGLDLRSPITSGIAGFAKAEWEAANGDNLHDEKDGFDARYMWVGLDFGQYGQLKVGKFEEAIKYAISPTDIMEDWGCYGILGNDDRRESVVQYQWSGYGFTGIVSYAFAKDAEHLDGAVYAGETVDLDYSVSIAAGYKTPDVLFGPIDIRAGYLKGEFQKDQGMNGEFENPNTTTKITVLKNPGTYDSYDQFAVSASWGRLDLGPYVAAMFQKRTFDYNYQGTYGIESTDYSLTGYELALGYAFSNGVIVRATYNNMTLERDDFGDTQGSVVDLFALWNLNSNLQLWGEVRFDAGTDDDYKSGEHYMNATAGTWGNLCETAVGVGLRYNF